MSDDEDFVLSDNRESEEEASEHAEEEDVYAEDSEASSSEDDVELALDRYAYNTAPKATYETAREARGLRQRQRVNYSEYGAVQAVDGLSEDDDEIPQDSDDSDFSMRAAPKRPKRRVTRRRRARVVDDDEDAPVVESLASRRESRSTRARGNMKEASSDDEDIYEEDELELLRSKRQQQQEEDTRKPDEKFELEHALETIVADRWTTSSEEADEHEVPVQEFLIKKRGISYRYLEWYSEKALIEALGIRAKNQIRRYRDKQEDDDVELSSSAMEEDQDILGEETVAEEEASKWEHVEKAFLRVDRVVACREAIPADEEEELPEWIRADARLSQTMRERNYLVKWRRLDYAQCTWETEAEINRSALGFFESGAEKLRRFREQRQIPPLDEFFLPGDSLTRLRKSVYVEMRKDKKENTKDAEAKEEEKEALPPVPDFVPPVLPPPRAMPTDGAEMTDGDGDHDVDGDRDGETAVAVPEEDTVMNMVVESDGKRLQPPYANEHQLRSYQVEGVNWLCFNWHQGRGCVLADEMGLGKTIQSVAYVHYLMCVARIWGPFLVVAPLSTTLNWKNEFERWTDINVVVYQGAAADRDVIMRREFDFEDTEDVDRMLQLSRAPGTFRARGRGRRFHACRANVVITTPQIVLKEAKALKDTVAPEGFRAMIVDEAHAGLKNEKSAVYRTLADMQCDHHVLLTGTPLQNNLGELWAILHFLELRNRRQFFGEKEEFLRRYSTDTVANIQALQNDLRPYMLRRVKKDVEKTLSAKEETVIEVELTALQKRWYKRVYERKVELLHDKGKFRVPSLRNVAMELRKCCNHPFLMNGVRERFEEEHKASLSDDPDGTRHVELMIRASGKFVLLDKLLPKLRAEGRRVLIFSQFLTVLNMLEQVLRLRRMPFERIDGSVRGLERQRAIDRYSAPDSDAFAFLLMTRAGGVGINLTAADTVVIFDSDWNPQNDLQAMARCHRIGQKKDVKVYRLITRRTYESEQFRRASQKLGLDKALLNPLTMGADADVLAQARSGTKKKQSRETVAMMERMLKYGAYYAFNDEAAAAQAEAAAAFEASDIDDILQRNSTVIKHEMAGENAVFSRATFRVDDDVTDTANRPKAKAASVSLFDDPDLQELMGQGGSDSAWNQFGLGRHLADERKRNKLIVSPGRRRAGRAQFGSDGDGHSGGHSGDRSDSDGETRDSLSVRERMAQELGTQRLALVDELLCHGVSLPFHEKEADMEAGTSEYARNQLFKVEQPALTLLQERRRAFKLGVVARLITWTAQEMKDHEEGTTRRKEAQKVLSRADTLFRTLLALAVELQLSHRLAYLGVGDDDEEKDRKKVAQLREQQQKFIAGCQRSARKKLQRILDDENLKLSAKQMSAMRHCVTLDLSQEGAKLRMLLEDTVVSLPMLAHMLLMPVTGSPALREFLGTGAHVRAADMLAQVCSAEIVQLARLCAECRRDVDRAKAQHMRLKQRFTSQVTPIADLLVDAKMSAQSKAKRPRNTAENAPGDEVLDVSPWSPQEDSVLLRLLARCGFGEHGLARIQAQQDYVRLERRFASLKKRSETRRLATALVSILWTRGGLGISNKLQNELERVKARLDKLRTLKSRKKSSSARKEAGGTRTLKMFDDTGSSKRRGKKRSRRDVRADGEISADAAVATTSGSVGVGSVTATSTTASTSTTTTALEGSGSSVGASGAGVSAEEPQNVAMQRLLKKRPRARPELLTPGSLVTDRAGFVEERLLLPAGYAARVYAPDPRQAGKACLWTAELRDSGADSPDFVLSARGRRLASSASVTEAWRDALREVKRQRRAASLPTSDLREWCESRLPAAESDDYKARMHALSLFGLNTKAIVQRLQQLPGVERLVQRGRYTMRSWRSASAAAKAKDANKRSKKRARTGRS